MAMSDTAAGLDAYLQSDPTAATPPGYTPAPTMATGLAGTAQNLDDALSRPIKGPPPPETWGQWGSDVAANTGASAIKGLAALPGLPHAAGQLADLEWDREMRLHGTPSPTAGQPGWLARHTYSGDELANMYLDPIGMNYEPKTPAGRIYSGLVSGAASGVVGGPEGAAARMLAGAASGGAGSALDVYDPNAPLWQKMLVTGGAGLGTNALTAASEAGARQLPGLLSSSRTQAEQTVVDRLRRASGGMTGRELVDLGDRRWQDWTTSGLPTGPGTTTLTGSAGQPLGPTLGDVSELPGIRGMVFKDTAAAAREGDPIYEQLRSQVNQAQRYALAGTTPPSAPFRLGGAQADRDAAVAAIPPGLSRQDAGEAFRQNLQAIYDQRRAARQAAGGAFDALKDNPAQLSLQPVRDYATEQASQNAGEIGNAYQAAGKQLVSATGISLDTASFAASARNALGTLASKYGREGNKAAQQAVFDVADHLDDHISSVFPEIGAARAAWARNSQPLDVFKAKPFGQALETDQYNTTQYLRPNDAIVGDFLTGTGAPDALDRLHAVFGDPEASTQALQRYIAGQVSDPRNGAIVNGEINQAGLDRVLRPYQDALMRFPTLQRQFSTARGAQDVLDQQRSYQQLYDAVEGRPSPLAPGGLGLQKTDAQQDPMLAPGGFHRFVTQNGPLIDQAYTPEQAAVIRRVDAELQNQAQTPAQKVGSGTAQTIVEPKVSHGPMALLGSVGTAIGAGAGTLLGHYFGMPVLESAAAGGGVIGGIGGLAGRLKAQRDLVVSQVQRQALTDPAYARSLLLKYNPDGINTPATIAAMRYIQSRTPLITQLRPFTDALGQQQAPQQQSQGAPAMQYSAPQLTAGGKLEPRATQ